jgi:hypothetical protein
MQGQRPKFIYRVLTDDVLVLTYRADPNMNSFEQGKILRPALANRTKSLHFLDRTSGMHGVQRLQAPSIGATNTVRPDFFGFPLQLQVPAFAFRARLEQQRRPAFGQLF